MKFPVLNEFQASRQMVNTFLGLDHNPKIADGAFYEMENLTSDHFPELSPRKPRKNYTNVYALGLIAVDVLKKVKDDTGDKIYPETELLFPNGHTGYIKIGIEENEDTEISLGIAAHKLLVRMGAYVLLFPDKTYINTLNLEDRGSMEASWTARSECTLTPCGMDGGEGNEYVKISAEGITGEFAVGDSVTIRAPEGTGLNGATMIRYIGDNCLVVDGTLEDTMKFEYDADNNITVKRSVPDMDFVIECGNRLWGCRYGMNADGKMVNELYCSKLGDFKNWTVYQGLADDAWSVGVGSSGPFTGAINYMGNPVFFKENCLHKVYVSGSGAHQVLDTVCRGVQLHCGKSLAIVGETLYYKTGGGVMAYDGSFPRDISDPLGEYRNGGVKGSDTIQMHNNQYAYAVGGAGGSKYYLSVSDPYDSDAFHLFVYDTKKNMWHREDNLRLVHMCNVGQTLYGVDAKGAIVLLSGTDEGDPVEWYAITGDLGLESPDKKYINRITLRLEMERDSELMIDVEYDHEGVWNTLCTVYGDRLGSFPVTVQPRRCDHLRLRLSGKGNMKIYSLTKTVMGGSDEE